LWYVRPHGNHTINFLSQRRLIWVAFRHQSLWQHLYLCQKHKIAW
jgi:hypothetical protein